MAPKTTTAPAVSATFQVSLQEDGSRVVSGIGEGLHRPASQFPALASGHYPSHTVHSPGQYGGQYTGRIPSMARQFGHVKAKHLGGISSAFESVKNLEQSFLNVDKQTLVEPRPGAVGTCVSTGLLQRANTASPSFEINLPNVYYRCNSGNCTNLSSKVGNRCQPCSNYYGRGYNTTYSTAMTVVPEDFEELEAAIVRAKAPVEEASSSTGQGFVKESIPYIVTDSLEIMPSTTIRSIKVLNKLKVATLSDLESSDITVSIAQVLQLLQAALTSSSCLNDVFGPKK